MLKFSFIFILSLIFIGLQDCAIMICTQQLMVASIMILCSVCLIFINNPQKFIYQLVYVYKNTPVKYLFYYILWVYLTSIFHIHAMLQILFRTTLIYILIVVPAIIFAIYVFPKYIYYKKLLKYTIYMCFFVFIYGIYDYVNRLILHSKPILYNILCSKNYFSHVLGTAQNMRDVLYERTSSIFFEPSFFATFIFLFLPMIYLLYLSNVKIFPNLLLDKTIKISLIFMAWLNLIFTKSPIYILLCIIYTAIFYLVYRFKDLKKVLIIIFSFLLFCVVFISSFDTSKFVRSENIILRRTAKVVNSIGDFDKLIFMEGSFATRLVSTGVTIQASVQSPIYGTGYGNTTNAMRKQYTKSNIPMTYEIATTWLSSDYVGPSPNVCWSTLLQTGLVGLILLYTFFIKSIKHAYKISKYFHGDKKLFLQSLILIAINYIIVFAYWSLDIYPMQWFVFGLLCSYIYIFNKKKRRMRAI